MKSSTILQQIHDRYIQAFQAAPLLIKAPGRINLIGEHTDYNQGFVLPAAIDQSIYFAMGKSSDGQLRLRALDFEDELHYDLSTQAFQYTHSWGRYIQAIIEILLEKGHELGGLRGLFGGDIPIGAGLSSSAALCSGFLFGLSELFDLQLTRPNIALIAQAAEHRIGLNCGLMDQYAVLFGRREQALCLDCQNLTFDYFPLQLKEYTLVLLNSKIEHQLAVDSAYNDRREACETVVRHMQKDHPAVESLRDISSTLLEQYADQLPPLPMQRARYVLEENQRVQRMLVALQEGDVTQIGQLLWQSHEGLSKEYEVSTPEVDLLVALARAEPAILGARMMGGGFGGCTLNLVRTEGKTVALDRIMQAYAAQTGIHAEAYEVAISDGVKKVELTLTL
ncbi:MAG: galactokinase [Bacteroidota bacterium]